MLELIAPLLVVLCLMNCSTYCDFVVVDPEDGAVQSRLANLRLKLAENGIDAQNCPSGQYSGLICPEV